ncbi:uncharacterized protein LOC120668918 isoform X1 [Panicum virgatum]|uniref:uncharacterized protein LOC120668918 isoform X1 n=1 Tax=Panicum virgatum TaxID=38727 RepID=UPI0019D68325|nr:uncharacterized protein LOC120668918 isoform X1 [Panicum virgatum]
MDLEDEDVKPFTKVPPGLEAFFAAQNMRSAGDNEGVRRGWLECTGWEWKGNEVEYEFQFDKMRLFVTSTDGSDKKGKHQRKGGGDSESSRASYEEERSRCQMKKGRPIVVDMPRVAFVGWNEHVGLSVKMSKLLCLVNLPVVCSR